MPEKDYTSIHKHKHQCPECGYEDINFMTYMICPRCYREDKVRYLMNTWIIKVVEKRVLINAEEIYGCETIVQTVLDLQLVKVEVFRHGN